MTATLRRGAPTSTRATKYPMALANITADTNVYARYSPMVAAKPSGLVSPRCPSSSALDGSARNGPVDVRNWIASPDKRTASASANASAPRRTVDRRSAHARSA